MLEVHASCLRPEIDATPSQAPFESTVSVLSAARPKEETPTAPWHRVPGRVASHVKQPHSKKLHSTDQLLNAFNPTSTYLPKTACEFLAHQQGGLALRRTKCSHGNLAQQSMQLKKKANGNLRPKAASLVHCSLGGVRGLKSSYTSMCRSTVVKRPPWGYKPPVHCANILPES